MGPEVPSIPQKTIRPDHWLYHYGLFVPTLAYYRPVAYANFMEVTHEPLHQDLSNDKYLRSTCTSEEPHRVLSLIRQLLRRGPENPSGKIKVDVSYCDSLSDVGSPSATTLSGDLPVNLTYLLAPTSHVDQSDACRLAR